MRARSLGQRSGRRAALALLGVLLGACSQESDPAAQPAPDPSPSAQAEELALTGDPAPDFTLKDLDGHEVQLSQLRGKVVVIDFWATWCPPCLFQVPGLNELSKAHAEKGDVVVLGVAIDVEGAEVVAPWVAENGVEYRTLLGDPDLAQQYGAFGFPALVVVRPDGRYDPPHLGVIEYEQLEELVKPLL